MLRLESGLPTRVSGEVVNSLNGKLPAQLQAEFGAMRRVLDVHRCSQETALAPMTSALSSLCLDRIHKAVVSQGKEQKSAHIGIKEAISANTAEIRNLRIIARTTLKPQPTVIDTYYFSAPDSQTPWQEFRLHVLKW